MSERLREVETDLTGTKEQCEQQAHDLLRKSSKYGRWCSKFHCKMLISATFFAQNHSLV